MLKKLLPYIVLLLGYAVIGQECPTPVLIDPLAGATNVPVNTTIRWNRVNGVPGYTISIGTTPSGTEILNNQSVGSATSYTPPLGLPANTQVYVTITLFFFEEGVADITCASETFRTEEVTSPPPCTLLSFPEDGATGVNVGVNLRWSYSPTATAYRLQLGTSPGASDVLDVDTGNTLSYNPPADLPENTLLFARVIARNENGSATACTEINFTTGAIAQLPGCTSLVSPQDGETGISLTPFLEWQAVAGADGYRVTIGNSPFTAEILDGVRFFTNSSAIINLEANRTFFITIIPFNEAGEAIGCEQQSFSTILGCGPYLDPASGELVTLNPVLSLPDTISFCENEAPWVLEAPDQADGFRWYQEGSDGQYRVISDTREVTLSGTGMYRYEAYNLSNDPVEPASCPSFKEFEVVSSELPTITNLDLQEDGENIRIRIEVSGSGNYEYSLDSPDGPFQDNPLFTGVTPGSYTVYVRDRNGCGIVSARLNEPELSEGFPRFFSPNQDGINDYWQFTPVPGLDAVPLERIEIYDRYGKYLFRVLPGSQGWDGSYNGRALPGGTYWYKALDIEKKIFTGYFTLKR
ncbi:T9SS type B sorting domain-containing protein [Zeaxanthinibacter enoshimensis]|uniref:Gliding motility-associated-like protein n=1 Tax=Zeaxanthinibacter enoshimensis TaxID=392009 RepID=A0A4R6TH89_9FLAO|nr:T9SS type B sorting domain-containing protein [Zeaxanthinibacter enoshimensis]TDQ29233.1 gliding motility-associated-like protein [Zeaxanthinibacter enoshimensis]